jgi:hypothetical protein
MQRRRRSGLTSSPTEAASFRGTRSFWRSSPGPRTRIAGPAPRLICAATMNWTEHRCPPAIAHHAACIGWLHRHDPSAGRGCGPRSLVPRGCPPSPIVFNHVLNFTDSNACGLWCDPGSDIEQRVGHLAAVCCDRLADGWFVCVRQRTVKGCGWVCTSVLFGSSRPHAATEQQPMRSASSVLGAKTTERQPGDERGFWLRGPA